ncbi:MAG: SMP-30/gluconolactonase/LRE family protein [Shinella zoogloeoides]|uniref:SMP-30/gluconolactonase/LRE family protein n=1 Tax=Shinella zoogloeoides TaxID=352475 RepID=UPI003C70F642
MPRVEPCFEARNIVGESLVWDDRENALWWVDIVGRRIHRFRPDNAVHESWNTPDLVTSIGLRRDGGAILGLRRSLVLFDFAETFRTVCEIEPGQPGNRLNEGVVGPDGCFWIGTMQNNIAPDGSPQEITASTGRIYRYTPDGTLHVQSDDVFGITNTFVWTVDGRFITADTLKNAVFSYAFDPTKKRLSDRKPLLCGFPQGVPDGSCLDEEGFIWNCRVAGGACIIRLSPEGTVDRVVDLPCSSPTSCTFGGPNLDILYVTSARFGLTAGHLKANPLEGAVFAVKTGHRGLPVNRFG